VTTAPEAISVPRARVIMQRVLGAGVPDVPRVQKLIRTGRIPGHKAGGQWWTTAQAAETWAQGQIGRS